MVYSVEENLRRRCGGGDGAQLMQRLMCARVFAGKAGERLCLGLVAMDGHDLDFLAGGETEKLEGLKRAYDFSPAAVRHDDSASIRQIPRDGHCGSGAIAKHLGKRGVRPILGREANMRLAPEDDHVAAWRLAQDAIYGIADALEHEPMSLSQAGVITLSLASAGSNGNGLPSANRGLVEHAKANQPCAEPARPVDSKRRCRLAKSGAVERNKQRSKHGCRDLPAHP